MRHKEMNKALKGFHSSLSIAWWEDLWKKIKIFFFFVKMFLTLYSGTSAMLDLLETYVKITPNERIFLQMNLGKNLHNSSACKGIDLGYKALLNERKIA